MKTNARSIIDRSIDKSDAIAQLATAYKCSFREAGLVYTFLMG